ncbi:hypothetical protein F5884DRAFT_22017 [Xylogone sp. PMI_703]|nr:hypothetical protein F5884DRAFT_22017 [Xylogone sp. PMI_703]
MASKATAESISVMYNSMPSMMPFLYQTKTLTSVSRGTTQAFGRSPLRISGSYRTFTTYPKNQARSFLSPDESQQSNGSTHDDSRSSGSRPLVRTVLTETKRPQRRSTERRQDDIPWEYIPASKAQADPFQNGGQVSGLEEHDDVNFSYSRSTGADNESEDNLGHLDEAGEITTPLDFQSAIGRESTITVSERRAFERIFADIFARSRARERDGSIPSSREEHAITTHAQGADPKTKLNSIISGALRRPKSSDVLKRMKAAVERYPPALRPAAARAMGLDVEQIGLAEVEEEEEIRESADPDHLEGLRKTERERVEALMREAETDFDLWDVMEREVFSLVTRMGVDDVPKSPAAKRKLKNKSTSKPLESTIPEGVSPLSLYGPLYPSHLLLGLRLLDRTFSQPSQLTFSLLPRIKSLGLISHILGASTAFYNELMRIYWHRRDDSRGILHLLEEMEQNGLEFDEETARVIRGILKTHSGILHGRNGPAAQAVWKLPEFSVQQFRPWRSRIEEAVEEKVHEQSRQTDGPEVIRTVAVY